MKLVNKTKKTIVIVRDSGETLAEFPPCDGMKAWAMYDIHPTGVTVDEVPVAQINPGATRTFNLSQQSGEEVIIDIVPLLVLLTAPPDAQRYMVAPNTVSAIRDANHQVVGVRSFLAPPNSVLFDGEE